MTVTKRLRYEILRRDNHSCRYCGGKSPDVALTVDHVTPVALGGSDQPDNLVAACRDCNAGKSASPVSADMVADVRQDALRWARAQRGAIVELTERISDRLDYIESFGEAWDRWKSGDVGIPRPSDWEESVGRWFLLGVPEEVLMDAISRAMKHIYQYRQSDHPEFRFAAKIIWDTVEHLNLRTSALAQHAPDGMFTIYEAYDSGLRQGAKWEGKYAFALLSAQALSDVVDHLGDDDPWFRYGAL